MKKIHIVARNHMDPSWLRCFTDHFDHPVTQDVVRPYADIEELLILEYMDFAEQYGVKYQIEQSLVVKKFLERNPDQKERLRALVQKGLIELAGGGECVIDYNLTQGESWVRNHLYSRIYYAKEFGHSPRYAITPDIFGLPSQLPQFFRSIGYDALIIFDRVMKNNKPFWKGLDGTLIVMDSRFLDPPEPSLRTADCVKLPACSACKGAGCAFCEGTGIDTSYNMTRPDKEIFAQAYYGNMSADELIKKLLETEKDEYFVMITTEEPRIGEFLYGPLQNAALRHHVEVDYVSFEENHDIWCKGQVQALRSGNTPDDMIDYRPEGNPAGAGCYTSRIEIKKENRILENLLTEAESLAAMVRLQGGWNIDMPPYRPYPQKQIELLWNKMAFIQFHDCVTGSHCDASYYELQRYIREVRRGAEQIYSDAAAEWAKQFGVLVPDGYFAAVVFNPTATPLRFPQIELHAPVGTKTVAVYGLSKNKLPSFDFRSYKTLAGSNISMRINAEIPAFGWRVFLWKAFPAEEIKKTEENANAFLIKNEYFRIYADEKQITGIYDVINNREMLGKGACCLAIGKDIGSPWGRAEPETDHMQLQAYHVSVESTAQYSRIVLTGSITDPQREINRLSWKQTVTLHMDEPLIRCKTELEWDGTNTRVFASFPPAFKPNGKIYCEVPFGTMEREQPELIQYLGLTDEWPSLGFAGLSDGTYNIAVLKGGFPATRLHEDKLQISLLRAFTCDEPKYRNTDDRGTHISEYALTAWAGSFADGNCAAKAAQYLSKGHTRSLFGPGMWIDPALKQEKAAEETGCLLPVFEDIPLNLRLSAVKWAENNSGLILRFWESTGKEATLKMKRGVSLIRCNSLEEPQTDQPVCEYSFRPFEIATFLLIKDY